MSSYCGTQEQWAAFDSRAAQMGISCRDDNTRRTRYISTPQTPLCLFAVQWTYVENGGAARNPMGSEAARGVVDMTSPSQQIRTDLEMLNVMPQQGP